MPERIALRDDARLGLAAVLADARSDAPWRAAMRLAPPTGRLIDAIDSLRRLVLANGTATYAAMLAAAGQQPQDEKPLDRMVRRALPSMLEERQTRRPGQQRGEADQGVDQSGQGRDRPREERA
jgi:hypothetical protein